MANYPDTLPREYRPLSAWAYFGYSILFSLPIIGFFLLLIFSFDSTNINRRNYARSYFCGFLIAFIFVFFLILMMVAFGVSYAGLSGLNININ